MICLSLRRGNTWTRAVSSWHAESEFKMMESGHYADRRATSDAIERLTNCGITPADGFEAKSSITHRRSLNPTAGTTGWMRKLLSATRIHIQLRCHRLFGETRALRETLACTMNAETEFMVLANPKYGARAKLTFAP